jgi:uncharacterized membrane protein
MDMSRQGQDGSRIGEERDPRWQNEQDDRPGSGASYREPHAGPLDQEPSPAKPYADRLARALGLFSVALGAAQLAFPDRVSRLVGVKTKSARPIMRLMGVRELAHGGLILVKRRPATFVWMRVAGDALDIALLRRAMGARRARRPRIAGAMSAVGGIALLDAFTAEALRRSSARTPEERGEQQGVPSLHGIEGGRGAKLVKEYITVNRPVEEVYSFWRDFSNLPRFMNYLEAVTPLPALGRIRWKTKGVAGKSFEWDAEIVEERQNELISWRSFEGSDIPNSGVVRFLRAPGDRGTEVHVEMQYEPPGGLLGSGLAKLFGRSAEQQIAEDLRRLRQVLETGEVVLSESVVGGRRLRQRPAQAEAA